MADGRRMPGFVARSQARIRRRSDAGAAARLSAARRSRGPGRRAVAHVLPWRALRAYPNGGTPLHPLGRRFLSARSPARDSRRRAPAVVPREVEEPLMLDEIRAKIEAEIAQLTKELQIELPA